MKGKKIIVPLLLAGMTATGVVANVQQQQQVQVSAVDKKDWSVLGDDIKVEGGFDIRPDGTVYLPKVTTSSGTDNYEYKVTKSGKLVTVKSDAEGYYFEATKEGYYNVAISTTTTTGVKTEVKNLTVWIDGQDAVINLPNNSDYVIPAKIPASLAKCAENVLSIPVPTVTIGDDEKETTFDKLTTGQQLVTRLVTPKTPADSKGIKLDNQGKDYYTVSKDDLATIGTYTIVYEYRTGTDEDDDGYLDKVVSRLESNFQVVDSLDLSKIKLTMTLLDSMPTSACVNKSLTLPKVKVTETASSLDAIKANVKVTIRNLTTGEILDDEEVFDYDTYSFTPTTEGEYLISYKASIGLFGKSTADVTPDQTIKVSDTASAVVMPTVNYTIENGEITKVNGVTVAEEKDGDKVIKTKAEVAEEMLKENTLENSIPSAVRLKNGEATITVPALFATDNFDSFKDLYTGKTSADKPLLERTYRAPNGAVLPVGNAENINEAQKITVSQAGTYEFRFKATDKAGNPAGYKEFEVVVYDSTKDMEADETKLELNIGVKTISDKDQVLKFSKPTVEDAYDKSITTKTFYIPVMTDPADDEKVIDGAPEPITTTNADGKYILKVADLLKKHTDLQQIKVYAEAYVDASLIGTRTSFAENLVTKADDGSIVIRTKMESNVINIVNSANDTAAAEFDAIDWNLELLKINDTQYDKEDPTKVVRESILTEGAKDIDDQGYALDNVDGNVITKTIKGNAVNQAAFSQGNDILYLPTFTIRDKFDANLAIMLNIKNDFGDDVSKVDNPKIDCEYDKVNKEYVYTVYGASFKLSNYGVYTVTYQATDVGGNIRVQTFGIRVNDTTSPTIVIDDLNAFSKDIEVGKKFEVPQGKLVKDQKTMDEIPTWDIYKTSKGAKYVKIGETGFVPLTAGTYTIKYTGVDENGNVATLENSLFTVTAKDSTAPVINVNEPDVFNKNPEFIKDLDKDDNELDYMTVYVPTAQAYDGRFVEKDENGKEVVVDYGYGRDLEVTYTITGPSGTSPEIVEVPGREDIMQFKATKQGIYTLTYSATDGIQTAKYDPIEIKIGDCDSPHIKWKSGNVDIKTEVKLGEEFKLIIDKLLFEDIQTKYTAENLEKLLDITMTDPDGGDVKNLGTDGVNFIANMDKAGSYSLKLVLSDEVGNNTSLSYSINVVEEEVEEETISPVLGTVLVVLSVVVLGGVVIYFVASSRKKSGKAPKKSSKK